MIEEDRDFQVDVYQRAVFTEPLYDFQKIVIICIFGVGCKCAGYQSLEGDCKAPEILRKWKAIDTAPNPFNGPRA